MFAREAAYRFKIKEMLSKAKKERRKQLHRELAKKAVDLDDYLIYIFLRFPGAFILWLVTGFKYKLGNIVREKGENAKEWIISILFYAIIIATLVIINN
jgi:uncharacterized Tic20 family protein